MSFRVVIPARFGSSRLPGKPLIDLAGQCMIERVYRRALQSEASQVVIATDDQRVVDRVKQFGGEVCLTRADHPSGTDRIQEVAAIYQWADDDIVVNVQGDEPLIPPAVINQVAGNLAANPGASAASLCESLTSLEDFLNPNCVKVVADANGMALYFSRAAMPWPRDADLNSGWQPDSLLHQRHIGIYAYRVGLLNRFVTWSEAPLEQMEKLEQLRILWQGEKIHMQVAAEKVPAGVDTQADVTRVLSIITTRVG